MGRQVAKVSGWGGLWGAKWLRSLYRTMGRQVAKVSGWGGLWGAKWLKSLYRTMGRQVAKVSGWGGLCSTQYEEWSALKAGQISEMYNSFLKETKREK